LFIALEVPFFDAANFRAMVDLREMCQRGLKRIEQSDANSLAQSIAPGARHRNSASSVRLAVSTQCCGGSAAAPSSNSGGCALCFHRRE
jgi:hypothetical protein